MIGRSFRSPFVEENTKVLGSFLISLRWGENAEERSNGRDVRSLSDLREDGERRRVAVGTHLAPRGNAASRDVCVRAVRLQRNKRRSLPKDADGPAIPNVDHVDLISRIRNV